MDFDAPSPDNQRAEIPASFVALFVPPGRIKPVEPWREIARRHEWCDDLAASLVDTAADKHHAIGVPRADILERIHAGLAEGGAAGVSADEARWTTIRLAELLGWAIPGDLPDDLAAGLAPPGAATGRG